MGSLVHFLPTDRRRWVVGILIFASFLLSTLVSRYLFFSPAVISPAHGVALASLVLGGIAMWPALFLASLTSLIVNGSSIISIIGFPIAYVVQAVTGAFILKKTGFDPLFARRRDVFSFMVVTLLSSMIVPTLGFGIRAIDVAFFDAAPLTLTWGAWWAGTLLSSMVLGAFLIRWIAKPHFHPRTTGQSIEIFAALTLFTAISIPLFWLGKGQILGISTVYFLLIPLFWIALRLGPRILTLSMLVLTLHALFGMIYGSHAIPAEQVGLRLFQTEVFLDIMAIIFFILVGIEEERKTINTVLRSHVGRLEDALAQLSQQNQAKSEFLAVLAHELRNPLAPLLSTVELMKIKHASGDPDDQHMLNAAEERVRTMGHLLDDLLDISRISQATFELQKEDVELQPAVARAMEIAKPLMDLRKHTMFAHLPADELWLHVDPVRFEQILVNLLTNSAKYTEPGGRIELFAARSNGGLSLSVKDNGIGIREDMIDRVFEPFQQVPTKRASGLGIGLSIVKKLIEMHNGTITATSRGLGKGSMFTLTLPASAVHFSRHQVTQSNHEKPEVVSAFKVLVVDDNEEAAQGLGKLLTLRGHTVTLAYAGADAIAAAKRIEPNIILLDIGLPDMDGYEVARSLREDDMDSALIALTGYGQDEDKQRAKNAGFDFHLTKPVGLAEIEHIFSRIEKAA